MFAAAPVHASRSRCELRSLMLLLPDGCPTNRSTSPPGPACIHATQTGRYYRVLLRNA
jgi:hypothetical protein